MPPANRGLGTGGSALWGAGAGRAPKGLAPSKGSPPHSKGELQLESRLSGLALPRPAFGDEAKAWKGQGAHGSHVILDENTES